MNTNYSNYQGLLLHKDEVEDIAQFKSELKEKGFIVKELDFFNPSTSDCYNPFEYITDEAELMAFLQEMETTDANPYPFAPGNLVLSSAYYLIKEFCTTEDMSFTNLANIIKSFDKLFSNMRQEDKKSQAYAYYKSFKEYPDDIQKITLEAVLKRLELFTSPDIIEIISSDTLNLNHLLTKDGKLAIILSYPDNNPAHKFLEEVLSFQLFYFFMKTGKNILLPNGKEYGTENT